MSQVKLSLLFFKLSFFIVIYLKRNIEAKLTTPVTQGTQAGSFPLSRSPCTYTMRYQRAAKTKNKKIKRERHNKMKGVTQSLIVYRAMNQSM
jgi:hypothetical protein